MPPHNVFAYTAPPGPAYPEYLSINVVGDQVKVTVRSPEEGSPDQLGVRPGTVATMTLPIEEMADMVSMPFKAMLVIEQYKKATDTTCRCAQVMNR